MEVAALAPYERALLATTDLDVHAADGRRFTFDVRRWLADADADDATVLDRCAGPVLDVGSGPGRLVVALAERGVPVMGLDIAATAVALTRDRGVQVLHRSVFAELPGEGRWQTVLLIDGNIGIGGDPARLLARLAQVVAPGGRIVVETHADPHADETLQLRFDDRGRAVGPAFDWGTVGARALRCYARFCGYDVESEWTSPSGRPFATLTRSARPDRSSTTRTT